MKIETMEKEISTLKEDRIVRKDPTLLSKIDKFCDKFSKSYYVALSEKRERMTIFIFSWGLSALMIILGLIFDVQPQEVEAAVSGQDQSGSFKGVLDVNSFALLFAAAPLFYMAIRKFKAGKDIIYIMPDGSEKK